MKINLKKEKQEKKPKHRVLDDFQQNAAGEYVYVGKMHRYCSEIIERPRAMRALLLIDLIIVGTMLGCGMVKAAGILHAMSVLLPYAVCIMMSGVLLYKLLEMWHGHDPMRDYTYKATVMWYDILLWVEAIASVIMFICEIRFIILYGFEGYVGGTILFLVCNVLDIVMSFIGIRFFKALKWEEVSAEKI